MLISGVTKHANMAFGVLFIDMLCHEQELYCMTSV